MKQLYRVLILLFAAIPFYAQSQVKTIDLSGEWGFQLDPTDFEKAFENTGAHKDLLPDKVILPGTTDSNKKGIKTLNKPINRLSRFYEYVGPAWYQKDVVIPPDWSGKSISLELERVLWISSVYVDGKEVTTEKSFSTPHVFDLSSRLRPGRHRISICVDNRVGSEFDRWSHAFTEYTQTCWNGIVGKIELRAVDAVNIKSINIYPDIDKKQAKVICVISNQSDGKIAGELTIEITPKSNAKLNKVKALSLPFTSDSTAITLEATIPMGNDVLLWDYTSPELYNLKAAISVAGAKKSYTNTREQSFGMRKFGYENNHFMLNNRKVFLRGTLECGIFPLTGYPDMSVEGWTRICKIVKDYGLNHIRFHSWCPPKEAFIAADNVGVLLQVELPFWGEATQKSDPLSIFLKNEMSRILSEYGNHPSFVMMCMGNELRGNFDIMADLVDYGRKEDPRHLYSGSTARKHLPQDEFYVSHVTSGGWITTYGSQGYSTNYDLSKAYSVLNVPGVAHEVGQRAIYPNFDEIKKYTGVLYPRNFEVFRDSLVKKGMLNRAREFFETSGNMTVMLYKESIEALLRTGNCGGFQLLDLHDFPGQGTALVGILDAFWDTKGLVTPEKFRQWCSETVPLLRMAKRTYSSKETFSGKGEIFHYGLKPITSAISWSAITDSGDKVASGVFKRKKIDSGTVTELGEVSFSLKSIKKAQKVTIHIRNGETVENSWDIWVYPDITDVAENGFVVVATKEDALAALDQGKKVLFTPDVNELVGDKAKFQNHFWTPIMFRWDPMTMGTLVQNQHAAFRYFPTNFYTEWQWWNIIPSAILMNLNGTSSEFKALIQPIDSYDRCNKLGILFEAKVGKGKLLMTSVNFNGVNAADPAFNQLLYSLKKYVASEDFNPSEELPVSFIRSLFKLPSLTNGATVIKCDSYETGYEASKVVDGNLNTYWHTAFNDPGNFAVTNKQKETEYPHEILVELAGSKVFSGFTLYPRSDNSNGLISKYEFYISNDGNSWGEPISEGYFDNSQDAQTVRFGKQVSARYFRFVAVRGFGSSKWASVAEIELLP